MDLPEKPLVIPIFIPHSGCPHQCAFCNQSIITKAAAGYPDDVFIHDTIQNYLGYKGDRKIIELAFFGGNFLGLAPREITRLLNLIQPYITKGVIHGVRFSTRPDTITPQSIDLISPFKISAVELGVQSMNDEILKQSNRGHTSEDSVKAVSLLKKSSFKVGAQVMAGLPGDHEDGLLKSTRDLAGLAPDFARIYPLMVLEGSAVAKWYRQGRYIPLDLETAVCLVKQMYYIFESAGVNVIRMGLQASDFMDDASKVMAGPWHPAFGHLVFSGMLYDKACEKIDACLEINNNVPLQLRVHPRSESRLRGDKNSNIKGFHKKYPGIGFSILPDQSLSLDQILVQPKGEI